MGTNVGNVIDLSKFDKILNKYKRIVQSVMFGCFFAFGIILDILLTLLKIMFNFANEISR